MQERRNAGEERDEKLRIARGRLSHLKTWQPSWSAISRLGETIRSGCTLYGPFWVE